MKAKHVIAAFVAMALVLAVVEILQPQAAAPEMPAPAAPHSVPRLPAPRLAVHPPQVESANEAAFTNAFARWHQGEHAKLTPEQAEAYLRENHRNAASLLAAARASGDKSYLHEAMEKFPGDPRVAFDAYFFGAPYDRDKPAPEENRKWLDQFRRADPENALPDYLAARDDFKAGRTDLAIQELQAAAGKAAFKDYRLDSLQDAEEAYRAAGYPEVEAKTVAAWDLLLPHLYETKNLSQNLVDLANQYRQSGDSASAQAVLEMGMNLGRRFDTPDQFTMISTLVGIAVEKNILGAMDPYAVFPDTGLTVQNRLDALNQQRATLKSLTVQETTALATMSEADQVSFYDRLRTMGEPAAIRWAVDKYRPQ